MQVRNGQIGRERSLATRIGAAVLVLLAASPFTTPFAVCDVASLIGEEAPLPSYPHAAAVVKAVDPSWHEPAALLSPAESLESAGNGVAVSLWTRTETGFRPARYRVLRI